MKIERVDALGEHAIRLSIGQTSVLLPPGDIDAVIQSLSLLRASMRPAVPGEPPRTQQYVVEIDPCWYMECPPMFDGAIFFLRHTGLGWTGFALPDHSLTKLHKSIADYLDLVSSTVVQSH